MRQVLGLISAVVFCAVPLLSLAQSTVQGQTDYATVGLRPSDPVLSGFTACRAELELAFAVSGLVYKTLVDEGQIVSSGDILMRLDQEIEKIDLARRKAILLDDAELRAAVARSVIARKQMVSAERIHSTTGGISLEEVQNRTLASKLAEIEISRLEAQAKLDSFDYETAGENLRRRTLTAPSDGIISNIEIMTGESAQVNDPVMVLCDLSQLQFVANIPVTYADKLNSGMKVMVQIVSRDASVVGVVKFISPIIDSASGLQEVKILISDVEEWLRPGMSANLVLTP